jgi:hypothetical protein
MLAHILGPIFAVSDFFQKVALFIKMLIYHLLFQLLKALMNKKQQQIQLGIIDY